MKVGRPVYVLPDDGGDGDNDGRTGLSHPLSISPSYGLLPIGTDDGDGGGLTSHLFALIRLLLSILPRCQGRLELIYLAPNEYITTTTATTTSCQYLQNRIEY